MLTKAVLLAAFPIAYTAYLLLAAQGGMSFIQVIAIASLFLVGYRAPEWWLDHKVSAQASDPRAEVARIAPRQSSGCSPAALSST